MKNHIAIRAITEGAVMLALATVLSLVKLFQLPQGGSVNLSMIPILFYCVRWGVWKGTLVGRADGLLQMLLDGAAAWGWQSIVLDYIIAFSLLGLSGVVYQTADSGKMFELRNGEKVGPVAVMYRPRYGVFLGPVIGVIARFAAHFYSGVTVFRISEPTELLGHTFVNPYVYSAFYNGSFLLVDLVICLVAFALLYKPLEKYFLRRDLVKE